jgi:hypothetical protein
MRELEEEEGKTTTDVARRAIAAAVATRVLGATPGAVRTPKAVTRLDATRRRDPDKAYALNC